MRTIFRCQFGSVIYGTNLPTSDKDYKSVFIPDAKDLILQRAPKNITKNTKKGYDSRNTENDIDDEAFSLQEYLKLLCQGQTPALDMLFAPKEFVEVTSPEWEIIWNNRQEFFHRGVSQFVGYTKQQAAKYGIKGSRVDAVRKTVEFLKSLDQTTTLHMNLDKLEEFVEANKSSKMDENLPLIGWEYISKSSHDIPVKHFACCGRKAPLTAKVKYALDSYQTVLDKYGERAKMAETNEGIDWKALYHSVRVGREAYELLTTGNITLPRPEKDLLLQIRKGELPYQQVAELIEEGLTKINEAVSISKLPDEPNYKLADKIVEEIYGYEIYQNYKLDFDERFQNEMDDLILELTKKFGW